MNLKERRILLKKTQEEVANDLNMQKQTYQNYEYGKREPDFLTLIKLADYYQVSIDYLLGHSTQNKLDLTTLTNNQKEIINITMNLNSDNCKILLAYANGLAEGQKQHEEKLKQVLNEIE